jgi:hypothetical protein
MSETSQNGWAASKDPKVIKIESFPIAGTTIKIRANKIAGKLLAAFAAEFHELVEPIDGGQLDDWGYAYRNVRGSSTNLSNHSSGTAIDLNATKHPLGKANTFTAEQQQTLDQLCEKYGLRGGYTYRTRKDDMHFEVMLSPDEATKLAKKLGL